MNYNVIAVDGTSCSGKGTICKKVAELTEYNWLDTGILYRSIAYHAILNDLNENNIEDILRLLDTLDFNYINNKIIINNEDINEKLHTNEIDSLVSKIASIKDVRLYVNEIIRNFSENNKFIIDGRDIASTVFPDAFLKFYIDADIKIRAERRMLQKQEKGEEANYDKILENLEFRDKIDKYRDFGALIETEDAYKVDTTNLSIDEAVKIIIDKLEETK